MTPDSYTDDLIRSILTSVKTIAVVGASPNPARPSHGVTRFLVSRGFEVFAVNPGQDGKKIAGAPAFASLASLPKPVDMIDVFRASAALAGLAGEVLAMQPLPQFFWTQLGVRDDAVAARLQEAGITVIQNRCPAIEIRRLRI